MKKIRAIVISAICAAAFAAAFLVYASYETYWLQAVETTIRSASLPEEFAGKKIVFISDLHCGEGFPLARLDGLVEKINSLNADIVLFGGDYVSRSGKDTEACFLKLAKIEASLGKFGVLGNHDIEAGKSAVLAAMENNGIIPLQNNNYRVSIGNNSISVAGVEETWYSLPDGLKAMDNTQNFTVFMSHDPSYLEKYRDRRAALMLTGHTHGGQITLFGISFAGLIHRYPYKYEKGIFYESDRTIVVTNGIGTGIIPLRFFARPQINLVTLAN